MKVRKNNNVKFDPKTERMVRAIQNGDNVKAYKCLEAVIKDKIATKIYNALEV